MINSRSKLIFIFLPGIKEHLKQHAQEDETFALTQRAVKVEIVFFFQVLVLGLYLKLFPNKSFGFWQAQI